MSAPTSPPFDSKHFRNVLGHFPTGVTIISGMNGDDPVGLTIGSFTSVSLDPPLVGFLPQTNSASWATMAESGFFCVNVLSRGQAELCWKFARSENEASRFDGVDWSPGVTGAPILDGVVASIECSVESVHEMGDHLFVIGRVVALQAHSDPVGTPIEPMLFLRGSVGGFEANQ